MGFLFGKNNLSSEKDETNYQEEQMRKEIAEQQEDGIITPVNPAEYETPGGSYCTIHFLETRKYLQRIRDLKHHIHLTEDRVGYRSEAGLDIKRQKEELENLRQELKKTVAEVAEEIGKLAEVNHQVIMARRYIDNMSWSEIARETDFKLRTVQKFHGRALPKMEKILLADGLITMEEAEEANENEGE